MAKLPAVLLDLGVDRSAVLAADGVAPEVLRNPRTE